MGTYAYNFDGPTGLLTYFARYKGDFTAPHFRWAESRDLAFAGKIISDKQKGKAGIKVEKVQQFLLKEKEKAEAVREQERYDLFLSPLERIVKANQRD